MDDRESKLRARLEEAKSLEEVTAILREAGEDESFAVNIWNEISAGRNEPIEDVELSPDELDAVSGGRNWVTAGCDATVEPGSWCWTHDACKVVSVNYDYMPVKEKCPECGEWLYDTDAVKDPDWHKWNFYRKCKRCGYAIACWTPVEP